MPLDDTTLAATSDVPAASLYDLFVSIARSSTSGASGSIESFLGITTLTSISDAKAVGHLSETVLLGASNAFGGPSAFFFAAVSSASSAFGSLENSLSSTLSAASSVTGFFAPLPIITSAVAGVMAGVSGGAASASSSLVDVTGITLEGDSGASGAIQSALFGTLSATSHAGDNLYKLEVFADNPVAYWPLNDHSNTAFTDVTHNGHDAASTAPVIGGLLNSIPGDAFETSLDFPNPTGADQDSLTVSNLTGFPTTGPYTLEGWLLANDNISNYQSFGATNIIGWGAHDLNLGTTLGFWINKGTSDPTVITSWDSADSGFSCVATIPAAKFYKQWHYFATTYNGSQRSLYIDGLLQISDTPSTSPNFTLSNGYIAYTPHISSDGIYGAVIGRMAHVAIYSTALSGVRINAHYAAGYPLGTLPLASFAASSGASASFSHTTTTTIYGYLYDPSFKPEYNATVTATLSSGGDDITVNTPATGVNVDPVTITTTTDQSGYWKINLFAPGDLIDDINPLTNIYYIFVLDAAGKSPVAVRTKRFNYSGTPLPLEGILA